MTLYLGTYPLGQSVLSLSFYVYLHFFLSFLSAPFRPHFASLCMFNLSSKQHSLSCQIFLSKSLINCLHLRNINLCFYLSPLKPFPITIYLFFYISLFSKHELSFKTILSIFVNIKHRYRNCWWLDSNPGHLASEATEPQPLSYLVALLALKKFEKVEPASVLDFWSDGWKLLFYWEIVPDL